jgi:hypothetical protein
MDAAIIDFFRRKAPPLAAGGYNPFPVMPCTKKPMITAWTSYQYQAADAERYATASVGVLCGNGLSVADADIYDMELAMHTRAALWSTLGLSPFRLGRLPKFALPYRIDTAIRKIASRGFRNPADPERRINRLEFLGTGNYLVTHGIHPDTLQEYAWPYADLATTPLAQLTLITPDQIEQAIIDFEAAAAARHFEVVQSASSISKAHHKPSAKGQQAQDIPKVLQALDLIPNDLPYDEWINLGLAIKGALGDTEEGFTAWLDFSQQSERNIDEYTIEKWDTFHPTKIGAGTILHLAQVAQSRSHLKVFKPLAPPQEVSQQAPQPPAPTEPPPPPRERPAAPVLTVVPPPTHPELAQLATDLTHNLAGEPLKVQPLPDNVLPFRDVGTNGEPTYLAPLRRFAAIERPGDLVQDMLRQASVYTLTAQPSAGKTTIATLLAACVAEGRPFAGLPVERGNVWYLSADDPYGGADRLEALARAGYPQARDIGFSAVAFDITSDAARLELVRIATLIGGVSLIVLDTLLAYTPGAFDNENDNMAMARFLNEVRELTKLPGAPTILILCHPAKRAVADALELIPRGGSAALAASDGNLAAWLDGDVVTVHHSAKMRGAFDEQHFLVERGVDTGLKNKKGRPVLTVMARFLDEREAAQRDNADQQGELQVLGFLQTRGKGEWVGPAAIELALNMPSRTARRYLALLLERGQVKRQGSARATMYQATGRRA